MSTRGAAAKLDAAGEQLEGAFDAARQHQQAEIIRLAQIQQQQHIRPSPIEEMMVQQMMDGVETSADIEVAYATARKILAEEKRMRSASGQQQQQQQQRGPMWQRMDQIRHVGVRWDLDQ